MLLRRFLCFCTSFFLTLSGASGVALAADFEPRGDDSMAIVSPEDRLSYELYAPQERTSEKTTNQGWQPRSADGGAGEEPELPRQVPTTLGDDLIFLSADEIGLIQQVVSEAYASGAPKDHVATGDMWSDHVDLGVVPDVAVDKHVADMAEVKVRVHSQQRAGGCKPLWPTGIEMCGAILDKFTQLGWPANWLGWPSEPEAQNPDGVGYRQRFTAGFIYWHPQIGAHAVPNLTMHTWERNGFEAGWLGYPTSDEKAIDGTVGIGVVETKGGVQDFQGGQIYRRPVLRGGDSAAITGAILQRWNQIGATTSMLGFPIKDEAKTPDGVGRFSEFEAGSIYWSPATGAWEIPVGIMQTWAANGFEQGHYGYPVGPPVEDSPYRITQQFQHGTITGYDARIVLLGKLLQLTPEELDNTYTTLLAAFTKDGKDPKQGFVDATNHAINSYNTTLAIANGENPQNRTLLPGPLPLVSVLKNPVPPAIVEFNPEKCNFIPPGTPDTRPGDVFFSTALRGGHLNHGHTGIFVGTYVQDPNVLGKGGAPTVEALNPKDGVKRTNPLKRRGVCRPVLMHVRTDRATQDRAVRFAESKVGKDYNNWFAVTRLWPYDAENYNCSQLVWAAYMKASGGSVNIGQAYPHQPPQYGIYPFDILLSYMTVTYARQ